MKLWEGNVFSCICLFMGVPNVTNTHDALDLTVQDPSLVVTSGDHYWRPVQACSLDLTELGPPSPTDI